MFDACQPTVSVEGRIKLANRWRPHAIKVAVIGALKDQLDGPAQLAGCQCRRNHLIAEQSSPETAAQIVLMKNNVGLGNFQGRCEIRQY